MGQHFFKYGFVVSQQIFPVQVKKDKITDAVIGMPVDIGDDFEQVFAIFGFMAGWEDRQCDVERQRVGT